MKTIEDLEKIGFRNIGYWFINDKDKLQFEIFNSNDLLISHLLYSFESNSIVKYIGITETSLKQRFGNYKSGSLSTSGSTNRNVYRKIYETITNGFKVNIWMLKENAPCNFKGFEISLATGIEKSLIREFDLKENLWNSRGTKNGLIINKKQSKIIDTDTIMEKDKTQLKLGIEARKGWLIFKNDVNDILPEESTHMEIFYKDLVIKGCRFTRSQNNKKINGGYELKRIFETDFKELENVKVTILGNKAVRIEKI